jgi:uncharacterized protein (DUF1330 family)
VSRPPPYLVAEFEVTDAASFRQWGTTVNPILKAYGGQFLVRANKPVAHAGEAPKATAIVMFESMEKAQAYLSSAEYRAVVPDRDKSSKLRSYLVGGIDAAQ